MLFDSVENQWIFIHQNQATVTSSMLIMGPETYDNVGNETHLTLNRLVKSINDEHIGDTNITDTGTKVSINSNTEVTGTLKVTGNITNPNITAIESATGSLNTFTSSLLTAIELTGSNLTVRGNFLVKGTTTNVNTSTLDVDNNLINLNGSGASFAGLRVKDTTAPSQISGSLLWDASNDYWIAGQLGSEQRLVRETEFNNAVTRIGNVETSTGSLNSFTSSINTTIKTKLNTEGVISGSAQVNHNATSNYDANQHVDHTGVSISAGNGLSGGGTIAATRTLTLDTGSTHFTNGVKSKLNTDVVMSGSYLGTATTANLTENASYLYYTDVRVKTKMNTDTVMSGSYLGTATTANLTENASYLYYTDARVKTKLNAEGVVSGSSQIIFGSISSIPSGLVSGSSQVLNGTTIHSGSFFNGISVVSGSAQIAFGGITGVPSGLVSGSAQTIANLPSGTVSGSVQVDLTATTNYASGILTRLNAVGVFSGSAQVTGIGNAQLTNSSFYIGTTSISLGRGSASQTLTGVGVDGNAGTATTLATARTLTVGGTGKSFNGSADVSWSLSEIGALSSGIAQQGGVSYVTHDFNSYPAVYNVTFINPSGSSNLPTNMTSVMSYRFIMAGGDTTSRGVDLVVAAENSGNMYMRERSIGTWSRMLHSNNYTTYAAPSTGSTSITTLGTIVTGTWNGSSIATTYTAAKVTSVVAGTGVTLSSTTGDVTVNIGQAVATSSSPTFSSLSLSGNLTLTAGYISGYVGATGNGDNYAPFRASQDYSSWMNIVAGAAGSANGWGLFWAGNDGSLYGTNQAGAAGNIWSNSTNPNEYVFVGNGVSVFSVFGNSGHWWSKGNGTVAGTLTVGGSTAKTVANSSYSTTFSSVSSVTVTHNLGTKDVAVFVYDSSDNMFWPSSIVTTSTSVVTITFASSRSGRVVVVR